MEAPIMLAVTIIASRWIVRRFPELSSLSGRLAMGSFALFLMLGAEFLLAWILQGISIREYVTSKDPVSGSVYYALLIVFALLPAYWRKHVHSS
jgi:hypothetical protein